MKPWWKISIVTIIGTYWLGAVSLSKPGLLGCSSFGWAQYLTFRWPWSPTLAKQVKNEPGGVTIRLMTAENELSCWLRVWAMQNEGGGEEQPSRWGFQGGVAVNIQAQSGVPNRAEQLVEHGGVWSSAAYSGLMWPAATLNSHCAKTKKRKDSTEGVEGVKGQPEANKRDEEKPEWKQKRKQQGAEGKVVVKRKNWL